MFNIKLCRKAGNSGLHIVNFGCVGKKCSYHEKTVYHKLRETSREFSAFGSCVPSAHKTRNVSW